MITSKELPSDLSKVLIEWAIAAGRYFQSEQTKFVHIYRGQNLQGAQTIPLVENTLFVLALFRSRLVELIQEGIELLRKILAFQNRFASDSYGNFPIYLHEYPSCFDASIALKLLIPFYWILKQFGHILGSDLRSQCEQSARLALEFSLKRHQSHPYPYSLAVCLSAAQYAYGVLWNISDSEKEGREKLETLASEQIDGWTTTEHLAELLTGLQMVYPSIEESPWNPLWQLMQQTWHDHTATYIGPCIKEKQEFFEPKANLYDLYGGFFAEQFSRRATLIQPYHLQASLIQTTPIKFDKNRFPFNVERTWKKQNWQTFCQPECAYTVLGKKNFSNKKTLYTPFRFIWGDVHRVHTFICQGITKVEIDYVIHKNTIDLIFDFKESSDEESDKLIEFFVDFHPDVFFTVKGQPASVFEFGQQLCLSLGQNKIILVFELLEGKGHFLGHIRKGNRPSQTIEGEKRYDVYDWVFFLRSIRREVPCKIKAHLSIESCE